MHAASCPPTPRLIAIQLASPFKRDKNCTMQKSTFNKLVFPKRRRKWRRRRRDERLVYSEKSGQRQPSEIKSERSSNKSFFFPPQKLRVNKVSRCSGDSVNVSETQRIPAFLFSGVRGPADLRKACVFVLAKKPQQRKDERWRDKRVEKRWIIQ